MNYQDNNDSDNLKAGKILDETLTTSTVNLKSVGLTKIMKDVVDMPFLCPDFNRGSLFVRLCLIRGLMAIKCCIRFLNQRTFLGLT